MKFGVWIPNCRHLATPGIIRGAAVRAEQLGYESVWVSDHVVVPRANIVNFGETIFEQIAELADCGVEHLVLEFLAGDGRELDEQMAAFAERVRPKLA